MRALVLIRTWSLKELQGCGQLLRSATTHLHAAALREQERLPPVEAKAVLGQDGFKSLKKGEVHARLQMEVGDWVKVKSGRIQGGLTKFKGPFRVQRVGAFFVVLENVERWNFRNVAFYQRNGMAKENVEGCSGMMFMDDDEVVNGRSAMPLDDYVVQKGVVRRTDECGNEFGNDSALEKRIRKPPSYLRDFVK
ncbi:hypothetical protein NDU88_004843 [Pleurodeles waltl]|uniref:Uncharacterized protein n=1 Tax=Pleurodeles waltl TaxID=8319 RepID=A0AAV7T9M7_PLEWA|nr:hypothetical protein NDU88_004843 [Pleurodeles waltl]